MPSDTKGHGHNAQYKNLYLSSSPARWAFWGQPSRPLVRCPQTTSACALRAPYSQSSACRAEFQCMIVCMRACARAFAQCPTSTYTLLKLFEEPRVDISRSSPHRQWCVHRTTVGYGLACEKSKAAAPWLRMSRRLTIKSSEMNSVYVFSSWPSAIMMMIMMMIRMCEGGEASKGSHAWAQIGRKGNMPPVGSE